MKAIAAVAIADGLSGGAVVACCCSASSAS